VQASNDSPDLAEQAAEWMVLLTCDGPVERARGEAGFRAWKAADARHAEAAARIEQFVAQVRGVRLATAGNPRPAREGRQQPKRLAIERDKTSE
jgi:transmembrane sensor